MDARHTPADRLTTELFPRARIAVALLFLLNGFIMGS